QVRHARHLRRKWQNDRCDDVSRVPSSAQPSRVANHTAVRVVVAAFVHQRRLDGGREENGELATRRIRARGGYARQSGPGEQSPWLDGRGVDILKTSNDSELGAKDVIPLNDFLPQIKDFPPDKGNIHAGPIGIAEGRERELGIDVLDIRSG